MQSNEDHTAGAEQRPTRSAGRRPWVAPKLEVFGTIDDLTRGAGGTRFDGGHPPGKSKSRV